MGEGETDVDPTQISPTLRLFVVKEQSVEMFDRSTSIILIDAVTLDETLRDCCA